MLTIKTGDTKRLEAGLLMIPVAEDDALHKDAAIQALVETAQSYKEFKGKKGDDLLLYRPGATHAERVLFLG